MVTRRAVLKGTAAASIGAIAAAHGAAPAEASPLDCGYGQLTGGALGAFYKFRDAYRIAVKFQKAAAELVFQEEAEGVVVFFKFFQKGDAWSEIPLKSLDSKHFPHLETATVHFSKIDIDGAQLVLQNELSSIFAKIEVTEDDVALTFPSEID